MKPISVLAVLLLVPACFAQRYRAPGGVTYTNPTGFGNILYPGTGSAPIANFPQRLGATVAGNPIGGGARRSRGVVSAYPVFVGGYYGGGGYYGDPNYAAQQQPPVNVTVVNAPPQAPTVIINQNFGPQQPPPAEGEDTSRVFQPTQPTASAEPDHKTYLIAFKDHSVYSAMAYWIEDKTMHYVTPQGTHNQASLDLIDLDFTNKLNH